MQLLEPVIALLRDLPEQDRQVLADLINQFAHQETGPERHSAAWETSETLGLLA
ncbi:hypothetical protein ACIBQ1_59615 [Nonomuraea sp. NPDC050153]|uniref:hypothetical protein n=1 Tax=Nonomuraea sp. NPDC050153 TaxID=3364359 RepID=UPI0037A4B274